MSAPLFYNTLHFAGVKTALSILLEFDAYLLTKERSGAVGNVAEALEVFANNMDCSAKVGNIAKCLILQGETDKALAQLGDCLRQLERGSDIQDVINRGYAYLWIAECYYCQADNETAKLFLILTRKKMF